MKQQYNFDKTKINVLVFIDNNSGGNRVLKEICKLSYLNLVILEKNKISIINFFFKLISFFILFKKIKKHKILCSDPILSILLYYAKVPFTRFVQGDDLILFNKRLPTLINSFYKYLYLRSLKQNIIVNSIFTKKSLLNYKKNIKIIGLCRPGSNFKYFKIKKKYDFVYIYRKAPWKGSKKFFDIMKCLDLLLENKINILLINLSNSSQFNNLKNINISYKEWVNEEEINKLFSESKFIISTSLNEGFGMPFLEAMQSGCIPFVPSEGGTSDFVTNNVDGYTYNLNANNKKIVKIIKYLLNEYNREKLNNFIKTCINNSQKFNWDNTRKEFESISEKKLYT